jgi:SAM-dependent methyltransferase
MVPGAADVAGGVKRAPMTEHANHDQRDFWSEAAGPKWLRFEAALDHLMQPVLDGVLTRADIQVGDAVLDIGCGTGASTVQLAKLIGTRGQVVGADISGPMLRRAAERAQGLSHASFIESDAQSHPFEPAHFNHLVSRFGVMFFENPVAAFANMSRAVKPGGRMTFAAWGQIPSNPFFTYPAQAARAIIGAPPKSDPDLPGPFAFRDPARVLDILRDAGLPNAECETSEILLTPQGSLADFADLLLCIGPADMAVSHFDATQDQIAALHDMLQELFVPFDGPEGFRIPAQINFYTASVA